MMLNNHNDGIIKPILDLFKKSKNYHNHNKLIKTILLSLNESLLNVISQNLIKSYHRWTGNPFMMRIKFHVHSCYFKMNSEILSNLVFQ